MGVRPVGRGGGGGGGGLVDLFVTLSVLCVSDLAKCVSVKFSALLHICYCCIKFRSFSLVDSSP